MTTTGERLAEAMARQGWSRCRLARESGISYQTIGRLLGGDLVGYLYTWVAVCDTMGISLADIIDDGDGAE